MDHFNIVCSGGQMSFHRKRIRRFKGNRYDSFEAGVLYCHHFRGQAYFQRKENAAEIYLRGNYYSGYSNISSVGDIFL